MSVNINLIQAGDIVFYKYEVRPRIVTPVAGELAIVNEDNWSPLANKNIRSAFRPRNNRAAQMVFSDKEEDYYIDRSNSNYFFYDYERIASEETKEVTIEQIADKFGVAVKDIRIKD